MRRAAFFDMDRTLVRVNTARLYARWLARRGEARRRDVARFGLWLARYHLGVIDAAAIARRLALPFAGRHEAPFAAEVERWVREEVLSQIAPAAVAEVERRRSEGWVPVLLTSSTVYSAAPVARAAGIEHVLASRLDVEGGVFTGRIVEPFCYAAGKVSIAERWAAEHEVELGESAFFTDSISDLAMLERVGAPVVVNPDPRLRWVARQRRWPTLRW